MPSNLAATMDRFNTLIDHLHRIDTFRQIQSVLSWDQETYMPPNAIAARTQHIKTMAGLWHEAWQDSNFASQLNAFIDVSTGIPKGTFSPDETAFLRETCRAWRHQNALSRDWVEAFSAATATAQHMWSEARNRSDFSHFAPYLQELVTLTHEKIRQLGGTDQPYTTLIDEFEPGMTIPELDRIFTPLCAFTTDFLKTHRPYPSPSLPPIDYAAQRAYSESLVAALGFNTRCGRLDLSAHPFTITLAPTDIRLTTRINPANVFESISSTLHEFGHGLYEQGLNPRWAQTPYGAARSMAIHESQSRFWEVFVGQSEAFIAWQRPILHDHFPDLRGFSEADIARYWQRVAPQWCRVESDIVTYTLHIMVRYACEKALFESGLPVADLPAVWNDYMHQYLGITITDDAQGVLQDVHWSAGLFGYFPSYTLGTLIAAQLWEVIGKGIPDMDARIREGDFLVITEWLRERVHDHGSRLTTAELVDSLGIGVSSDAFMRYIERVWQ